MRWASKAGMTSPTEGAVGAGSSAARPRRGISIKDKATVRTTARLEVFISSFAPASTRSSAAKPAPARSPNHNRRRLRSGPGARLARARPSSALRAVPAAGRTVRSKSETRSVNAAARSSASRTRSLTRAFSLMMPGSACSNMRRHMSLDFSRSPPHSRTSAARFLSQKAAPGMLAASVRICAACSRVVEEEEVEEPEVLPQPPRLGHVRARPRSSTAMPCPRAARADGRLLGQEDGAVAIGDLQPRIEGGRDLDEGIAGGRSASRAQRPAGPRSTGRCAASRCRQEVLEARGRGAAPVARPEVEGLVLGAERAQRARRRAPATSGTSAAAGASSEAGARPHWKSRRPEARAGRGRGATRDVDERRRAVTPAERARADGIAVDDLVLEVEVPEVRERVVEAVDEPVGARRAPPRACSARRRRTARRGRGPPCIPRPARRR